MRFRSTKNSEILNEFRESDMNVAKIEGWTHASAHSFAGSLRVSMERYNIGGISVHIRNGEVFLVKE